MEMKEIDKLWEYWKIQEKIEKLQGRNAKLWADLVKNDEKIEELRNLQRKYE